MHYVTVEKPTMQPDAPCPCRPNHACSCDGGRATSECPCYRHLAVFRPYCYCGWDHETTTSDEAEWLMRR